MRRHLITLVLTTGTLVSTDAARLSNSIRDKDTALLPRRQPGLASGLDVLDRHTLVGRSSPGIEFIQRAGHHRYNPRDDGKDDSEEDSEDEDDDHKHHDKDHDQSPPPTPTISQYIPTFATSTGIPASSTSASANAPSTVGSITPHVTPSPAASPTGQNNGIDNATNNPVTNPESHSDDNNKNDDGNQNAIKIALGVLGALLSILIALLLWYWVVFRPKQRERLRGQYTTPPKDSDIESHVTMDLRGGPHDAGSSSDGLSRYATSTIPAVAAGAGAGAGTPGHVLAQGHQQVAVESAARSISIQPSPHVVPAAPYGAANRASPTMSHAPFVEAYAAPHPAYSQDHIQSYSPLGNPQGAAIPPVFPAQGLPSPLRLDAFPMHPGPAPTTMELDGRPPPPRYPGAIATSQVPGASPTSPLPVSPLSVDSPHVDSNPVMGEEPQYHSQQYKGPRQPSYGDYEPSPLPEVVSPMCQLGQTSASLPEYDESAEAARSGVSNHHNLVSQHRHQGGDEKQALSSQQPMPRY
ncbi:hypothetical protein F4859DRAFT_358545 [Xylaria cf. heliscus]|nr:hypothetical protein F4859DRAFT_358545 [Xylaria cf. heliscus]